MPYLSERSARIRLEFEILHDADAYQNLSLILDSDSLAVPRKKIAEVLHDVADAIEAAE